MKRPFRFTPRLAWLLVATMATLLLSIVFDFTRLATFIFPALWVTSLRDTDCRSAVFARRGSTCAS